MLKPDYYFESVFHIPYDRLYELGIRALIYDIDNTLASYDDKLAPEQIRLLVKDLKEMGFKVGLLSNNNARRVDMFNEPMGLPSSSMSGKPFTIALMRLMGEMAVQGQECAIVGDQILADVWCGKRAGITTVLVKPLTDKEVITVRLKRIVERPLLKKYLSSHVNPL